MQSKKKFTFPTSKRVAFDEFVPEKISLSKPKMFNDSTGYRSDVLYAYDDASDPRLLRLVPRDDEEFALPTYGISDNFYQGINTNQKIMKIVLDAQFESHIEAIKALQGAVSAVEEIGPEGVNYRLPCSKPKDERVVIYPKLIQNSDREVFTKVYENGNETDISSFKRAFVHPEFVMSIVKARGKVFFRVQVSSVTIVERA